MHMFVVEEYCSIATAYLLTLHILPTGGLRHTPGPPHRLDSWGAPGHAECIIGLRLLQQAGVNQSSMDAQVHTCSPRGTLATAA